MQEAVRTTVLGLLGSLPRHAFETTAIATGDALANLMFQLQMTGYMFKNAEYRLSLQSSMRTAAALPPGNTTDCQIVRVFVFSVSQPMTAGFGSRRADIQDAQTDAGCADGA